MATGNGEEGFNTFNQRSSQNDDIMDPFAQVALRTAQRDLTVRPSTVGAMRENPFQWYKAPAMDRSCLTATARMEAALMMEKTVKHKDHVIRALAKQLRRANEEKFRLTTELAGYRGPKRETLYKDNCVLRERLDRLTRENLMLRGLDKRGKNRRIIM